jgi:hypothetical protein
VLDASVGLVPNGVDLRHFPSVSRQANRRIDVRRIATTAAIVEIRGKFHGEMDTECHRSIRMQPA